MAYPKAYPELNEKQVKLFWQKVKKGRANECWPWRRAKKGRGYGALTVNKQPLSAHRVAWELAYGPIPNGQSVYHAVCNNPACCNHSHMAVGTKRDAMLAASNHGTKLGRAVGAVPKKKKPRGKQAKPYPKLTEKQERAFWKKVDKQSSDDCWTWTAAGDGYGRFRAAGRLLIASRLSFILKYGAVPIDMDVCHNCPDGDNPSCVNPKHLFLGTRQVNMIDCVEKGRNNAARGICAGKTKLTESQVYEIRRRGDAGESRKALAIEFGVSSPSICDIIYRKSWDHLEEIE